MMSQKRMHEKFTILLHFVCVYFYIHSIVQVVPHCKQIDDKFLVLLFVLFVVTHLEHSQKGNFFLF